MLEQRCLLAFDNVRVNTLVGDPNGFTGNTQSETSTLAYTTGSSDQPTILTFFNDQKDKLLLDSPSQGTGFARSVNGGASFDDLGTLPALSGSNARFQAFTDPVMARNNSTGRIYFAALAASNPLPVELGGDGEQPVVIFRSDDGGSNFVTGSDGLKGR